MEKAEKLIEGEEKKINDDMKKLDNLDKIDDMDKLRDISLPGEEHIEKAISNLKSFNDLPLKIDYPEGINADNLPQKLDLRPKPFGNKRKDINGKTLDKPDHLLICLNNRKFTVSPEIGSIDTVSIDKGDIILKLKVAFVTKNEIYKPDRMTKLLATLRNHRAGLNQDIPGTILATVKEIK